MFNYVKPEIIVSDNFSEGVYAASGNADCWSIEGISVQSDGSHNIFEIKTVHSSSVQHISSASTITLTFNNILVDAYSEFPSTFSGNTITITRELHGNAYKQGDLVTFKVWAKSTDEAMTKSLAIVGKSISCTKTVNVQGQGGDGN